MKSVEVKESNDSLAFETAPGKTYVIDRASTPWEDVPIVVVRSDR